MPINQQTRSHRIFTDAQIIELNCRLAPLMRQYLIEHPVDRHVTGPDIDPFEQFVQSVAAFQRHVDTAPERLG